MDELKLRPCPFCGGEAYMVDAEIDGRAHYIVKCGTCYSTSGVMQLSRPEAVAAWNRRAERTCRMVEVETGELADYSDTDEVIFHCAACHAERGVFSYDMDGNVYSTRPWRSSPTSSTRRARWFRRARASGARPAARTTT